MEKIIDTVGDALKDTTGGDRVSFKEEFMKARDGILGKLPTPEQFMNLIDQLKDISEEEKEKLKRNLADRALNADKFKEMFTKKKSIEANYLDYFVFIGMVMLIVVVFGERILTVITFNLTPT